MARIFITGAQGFIGKHLALWLSRGDHEVIGLGHGTWPRSEALTWGVSLWLDGEIDAPSLQYLTDAAGRPDCVFHLAGGSSVGSSLLDPLEDFERTVVTTAQLLEWVRTNCPQTRVVAVSSAAVYGSEHLEPINEGVPASPCSPYGRHKLIMEQLCRSYSDSFGLSTMVVRLFSVYGPWLKKQLLWDLCCKLDAHDLPLQLSGTGDEVRDWIDVRDAVRVLDLARNLDDLPGGVINGGSGIGTPVRSLVSMVIDAWAVQASVRFDGLQRPGDPFSLVADATRLKASGFEFDIPLLNGVRNYVSWFLENRS